MEEYLARTRTWFNLQHPKTKYKTTKNLRYTCCPNSQCPPVSELLPSSYLALSTNLSSSCRCDLLFLWQENSFAHVPEEFELCLRTAFIPGLLSIGNPNYGTSTFLYDETFLILLSTSSIPLSNAAGSGPILLLLPSGPFFAILWDHQWEQGMGWSLPHLLWGLLFQAIEIHSQRVIDATSNKRIILTIGEDDSQASYFFFQLNSFSHL